jgi:molybdopterin-containing oxidoreductase family membrane subunit
MLSCNVMVPQFLWIGWIRHSVISVFLLSLLINVGMWLERFVIIVTSLHRDYLPSSWGTYSPTFWDWSTFVGSIGLFFCLFFLFARVLPVISMSETRELVHETHGGTIPPAGFEPSYAK